MRKRRRPGPGIAVLGALLLCACGEKASGPLIVSAIGEPPRLLNPNLEALDPPAALLAEATAQGLVRFEASGQIEPALAQRWIVSDDGLRYTFRLAPVEWVGGGKVTASQVVSRLRAAIGASSRNPLKPLLTNIDEIVSMTDDVLEISLNTPSTSFLHVLAQPEMAILRNNLGSGPYRGTLKPDRSILLRLPKSKDPQARERDETDEIILRGERAALAVARFKAGLADLTIGGTAGNLLIARAGQPTAQNLRFDPVAGYFGLAFVSDDGPLADPAVRQALSMAIDRTSLVNAIGVPALLPRASLLPTGLSDVPAPSAPEWGSRPLAERRAAAARTLRPLAGNEPLVLRVAMPEGPGYRVILAFLRRDWRAVGIEVEAVSDKAPADLKLIDKVAPAAMASWYLQGFSCAISPVCSAEADEAMHAAATAPLAERRALIAEADRLISAAVPFIPLTAPVRWSLVSQRLTGFTPNAFGRHAVGELIAEQR